MTSCYRNGHEHRAVRLAFKFERYLLSLPYDIRSTIIRFRIGPHRLELENGRRYHSYGVQVEKRICKLCKNGEDEIHFFITMRNFGYC